MAFNALGNKCVECFSHRSDRLRCNRDDGKVVASKFVGKISIPSFAFDWNNHFCPQGIRLTEFLGGEPSIQLRYRDRTILHYNTASWRENQVERKRKKVYPIKEMLTPERGRQERCCIGSAVAAGAGEGALHGKNQKKEKPPQRGGFWWT